MKFPLVALSAAIAFATVNCHYLPAFGEGPLYEDIQYFIDMIPMEKVVDIILQYTIKDAEFQQLLKYMKSDDFKQLVQELEAIPEFHTFVAYLQNNGVYINDAMNKLNKVIGLPPFQPLLIEKAQISGGLTGLFNDVKALVSYDSIIHGYVYKMRTSEAFRGFVAELKSGGNQDFVDTLYKNQRFLSFRHMLVTKGLDLTLVEDVIYIVLGIEFPAFNGFVNNFALYENTLSKDIHDFIDLIDMDKIINIVSSYLDDDQVIEAVNYMRSEEFHVLVRKVEALKAYQDLVEYLHDAGLDIYGLLEKVHVLFGMEDYVPPKGKSQYNVYANRGGVKAMVDAVIATLPMDKFRSLYKEKMQNSPDFKNFIEKLDSDEIQVIVNTIYKEPIVLEIRQKALENGLDLSVPRRIFEEIGIKLPTPSRFFYTM
ncbi:uncharacterized protein LOC100878003 [Megachile rotundata]|uniref:uncharacterized protein LOC100878003 n=1 Tax=Megachile rotundata TaxID=143995 RepID=UPI003FD0D967